MAALAQMTMGQSGLAVLIILTCCFLMLVILLQRGRGQGLSGAFGGGGGGGAFGAKTGDVFTWITVTVAAIFLLLAVVSNFAFDKSGDSSRDRGSTTETTSDETEADAGTVEIDAEALTPITVESETPSTTDGDAAPGGETTGTEGQESKEAESAPAGTDPERNPDEVPPSP